MSQAKYKKNKTVEDLLTDESFLAFCEQSNQEVIDFWKNWIEEKDENKKLADQAVLLLKAIRIGEKKLRFSEIETELERAMSRLNKLP